MSKDSLQNSHILIRCIKSDDLSLAKNLEKITTIKGEIYYKCRTCGYHTRHVVCHINDENELEDLK